MNATANALVQAFVLKRDVGADFERCKPWLEAALEYAEGTHTIDDIRAGVAAGTLHFWPGEKCAAITEVFHFPRKRVLNVFLAGGDLVEILRMEREFCSWGRYLGCSEIVMTGREGWTRPLKNLDWRRRAVVLAKSLEAGSTT